MSDNSRNSRLCHCKTDYCIDSNVCGDNLTSELKDINNINYDNSYNSSIRTVIDDKLNDYKLYKNNRNEYPNDIIEYFGGENRLKLYTFILIIIIILIIFF
jgi:hypothetical protein